MPFGDYRPAETESDGLLPIAQFELARYRQGHSALRPVREVLFPTLRQELENNFAGMTVELVELDVLLAARERMVHEPQQV